MSMSGVRPWPRRLTVLLGGLVFVALVVVLSSRNLEAQAPTLQADIANDIIEQGYWDESGSARASEMDDLVTKWGDEFAFAITDQDLQVSEDQTRNAAVLLAQSTLDQLVSAGGPDTLFFVTQTEVGGASTTRPFLNLMTALEDFDRSTIAASFDTTAERATEFGVEVAPLASTPAQSGFFSTGRIFVILAIVTGILALASARSAQRKKSRTLHTTGARDGTKQELQEMSDLILDLDPRVSIANDPKIKERYVDASSTYRQVLEQAEKAVTGHEIADLRIEITKARWKLDVVDAELDGRTPPDEPLSRNTDGSAWDSTRGSGAS